MEKKNLKVEELSRFGQSFMEPPKSAAFNVMKIMFKTLKKELGFKGSLSLFVNISSETKIVKDDYAIELESLEEINKGMSKMVAIYVSIFRILGRKFNRERAYEIVKTAMQDIGRYNMPLIYDVKSLPQCQGDLFENFKKLNLSAFLASKKTGAVDIGYTYEDENRQEIHINRCDGCIIGGKFGWPEIGRLGCDHDIAGFKEIEDDLGIVFRRHRTIAKGDNVCDFTFYRKGYEPIMEKELK